LLAYLIFLRLFFRRDWSVCDLASGVVAAREWVGGNCSYHKFWAVGKSVLSENFRPKMLNLGLKKLDFSKI